VSTDTFKASVQYNDLAGSSAADRADMSDASKWLHDKGLIQDDELLVGYEIYVGQLSTGPSDDPAIHTTFLLAKTSGMDPFSKIVKGGGNIDLRKVTEELSPKEFFSLFKRFSVTLSSGGLLEGREYNYTESDA